METLLLDLCHGARTLVKNKAFFLVSMLTLGLAIGANTTIFTLVDALLLRPLPFAQPDRIVFVWAKNDRLSRVRAPLSHPDYLDLRKQMESVQDLAALGSGPLHLTVAGAADRLQGARVTANWFPLMGVAPAMGRGILPEEDRPGAGRVAILSYGCWQRRFGADVGVLGRHIVLDGERATIVGVMTPELEFGRFRQFEVWVPLALEPSRGERDRRELRAA